MKLYEVFHRTWWIAPGEPGVGEPHHIEYVETEDEVVATAATREEADLKVDQLSEQFPNAYFDYEKN